jgi:hypothetical protein
VHKASEQVNIFRLLTLLFIFYINKNKLKALISLCKMDQFANVAERLRKVAQETLA